MVKGLLQINKIPATTERIVDKKVFPKMPKLYLELIENKNKIIPSLVNKEHVYNNVSSAPPVSEEGQVPLSVRMDELLRIQRPVDSNIPQNKFDSNHDSDGESDMSEGSEESNISSSVSSNAASNVSNASSSDGSSFDSASRSRQPNIRRGNSEFSLHSIERSDYSPHSSNKGVHRPRIHSDRRQHGMFDARNPYPSDIDNMRQPPPEMRQPPPELDFTLRDSNEIPISEQQPHRMDAPSLRQLNVHQNTIPSLNNFTSSEDNDDLKRELLFKFELLKKSYKETAIPEFSMHSDYNSMKQTYDKTLKRLSIESSVDSYKTYLIGGFMLVEYGLGNYMGLDMKGFTQQQIVSMSQYERLLVELGEKSYVDEESQWPVELRLFGLIIMQAVFFVVSKLIAKKTGSNLLNMINSMNLNNQASTAPESKKRMRGPTINLDELPTVG